MSETSENGVGGVGRFLALVKDVMALSEQDRRGVSVQQVQAALRAVRAWVGGAVADGNGRVQGVGRARLDMDAWLVWAEVGLDLFVTPSPAEDSEEAGEKRHLPGVAALNLNTIVGEARRIAIVVAMVRARGNLSHAAKDLGTSRNALRGQLKAAGLYPWDRVMEQLGHDAGGAPTEHESGNDGDGGDGA